MIETRQTWCRNCSAACAMAVDVLDGRLLAARPDRASASPYGAYLCPKGLAAVEHHNGAENRLMTSLCRAADGTLAPIGTAPAVAAIGDRLAAIVARHGPRAIAFYHGTGAYRSVLGGLMERAFQAALGTPNFFSSMTIDQSAKWVTMARMGVMASGRHAMRDADLIVLAGGNPLVSHQGAPFALVESGAPARGFEALKARGGRVVLIDPRRSETARFADLLIQPLPGHDAEIFAAIAHCLLRDATFKADFVARHGEGLEELRAALAPFTPQMAAARADIAAGDIETVARWLGEARRPLVGSGTGPSMAAHSNLADHCIELVNVLAGGYRRAGEVIRNPGTLRSRPALEMALAPTRSFEQPPFCVSAPVGPLMGELPTALLPREITADHPDRIRALIVFGGDPLMALGDPALAEPAFAKLDLLVSLDSRLNETGRRADYVIAASQPFERHDLSLPADTLYPAPFAQYAAPLVAAPEGVIDDWHFFWAVAARMGQGLTFKSWSYGQVWQEIAGGLPLSLETPPDPVALCRYLAKDSRVAFDDLVAHPGGLSPPEEVHRVAPAPPGWAGRLALCPDDVARELAALAAEAADSARDDAWPMRLTCRRILHALNGAFRHSHEARRRHPVNPAWCNPEDMAALGIGEGARVTIESPAGSITAIARSEARLRRGVVSMTHLFGPLVAGADVIADGGANVGGLVSLSAPVEPINSMPLLSGIPVRLRALR
ncbi:MAG: molybdopterin-dependent oxidoreductase [Sphingomonadales bacterium]|nr:molybdopterin-dependent oxidoreductase [Sphingomonadales bacterium]